MNYRIENPGPTLLPCGLGTHPYFRVPPGGTSAGDCLVRLPVTRRWELKELIPTGTLLPVENAAELAAGAPFATLALDDVFSGLQFDGDWCQAGIHDPSTGAEVTVRFDRAFRECVVYTPPHREAICIEPYTCVPGTSFGSSPAFDAGVRLLGPGEAFEANVEFAVR